MTHVRLMHHVAVMIRPAAQVTAHLPPYEPVVVNVCHISGGEAFNVVPDVVRFGGTVRYVNHTNARQQF